MIKIEFSLAITLYLIVTTCVILLMWLVFERRNVLRYVSSDKNFFWQCDVCTYVYVDTVHKTISTCPRCRSYNKREPV